MRAQAHEIARFVPTLERARALGIEVKVEGLFGLFDRDLIEDEKAWRPLAALRVDARVQTRAVREVRTSLPVRIAEAARGAAEPVFGVERVTIVPHGPGEIVPCTACTYRPGRELCRACGGTGVAETGTPAGPAPHGSCRGCHGVGSVACSRCEGRGQVWIGRSLETDDRFGQLRHVYAPEVSLELQEAIAETIEWQASLPDCLVVSLEPRVIDPYRGTLAGHSIAGHPYDAAIPIARSAIAGLSAEGEIVRSEIVIHAWPFLLARAKGTEAALIVDPEGILRCLRVGADAI